MLGKPLISRLCRLVAFVWFRIKEKIKKGKKIHQNNFWHQKHIKIYFLCRNFFNTTFLVCSSFIKHDKSKTLSNITRSVINCTSSSDNIQRLSFDHFVTLTGAEVEYPQNTIGKIELNCIYDQDVLPIQVNLLKDIYLPRTYSDI